MTAPNSGVAQPSAHNQIIAYRRDIDGLRAVAIISVLAFHAFPAIFRGGFVGVDVFFVISGFLISSLIFKSLAAGRFDFAEFYAHRVKRIFPALIAVFIAALGFGWFDLLPDEFKILGKHVAGGAGFVLNFVLERETGYFDVASALKPLMHLWSLSIEEQFYLLYPLLVWGLWRLRLPLAAAIMTLAIISFAANAILVAHSPVDAFFLPYPRFWELLIGAALAYRQVLRPEFALHAGTRDILGLGGVVLVAASIFGLDGKMAFPGWWALFPVIGAASLILAGPETWANRVLLANRPMVFIGLISYPLYLWHWPLLTFARILNTGEPPVVMRLAALLVSVILAWLTYRLIERPIRYGPRPWIKTIVLAAIMVALGAVGLNIDARDGLEFRLRQFSGLGDQLKWDHLEIPTTGCREQMRLPEMQYCLQSGSAPPKVVLIGDSHANSLYPGLAAAYRKSGTTVLQLGSPGCLPFLGPENIDTPATECEIVTARAIDFATHAPTVDTIIVATYALRHMTGTILGNEDPNTILPADPVMFAARFRATLRALTASNRHIAIVIDWPELGFSPKLCFAGRPLAFKRKPAADCFVTREAYDARAGAYRQLIATLRGEFPQVVWFDPVPALCSEQICPAIRDGHVVYRDDHHLSKFGSAYLGQLIADALMR
jgi:peptidoglycan/LPS O-acetylase OafA/YrhL